MKSNRLVNFLIGTSIVFSGCNVQKNISNINLEARTDIEKVQPIPPKLYSVQDILPHAKKAGEIEYISDYETYGPGGGYWQSREETIERDSGNCVDKTILVQEELKDAGIEVPMVIGEYRRKDTIGHTWLVFIAEEDGRKKVIECSGKGNIYDIDSIRNSGKGILYMPMPQRFKKATTKSLENPLKDYYDRTKEVPLIKDFEYLQAILQLWPSEKF